MNPWYQINLWIGTLPTREERNFASLLLPATNALVESQRHYGGPVMLLLAMRGMVEAMR